MEGKLMLRVSKQDKSAILRNKVIEKWSGLPAEQPQAFR
jgi:hypothetical protein